MCKGNGLLYVIMLTERKIDLNLRNHSGDTALHTCVHTGAKENIRIIQKLLDYNADANILNNHGQSFYSLLGEEFEKQEEYKQSQNNKSNKSSNIYTIFNYILVPAIILLFSLFIEF